MNRRFALLILALCMALACAGCRLAREEESAQDSRLVGVTLKIADWGEPTGTDEEGNPYWALTDGEGPDEDPDALGQYSLILLEVENEEGRGTEAQGVWPGEGHTHITVTDEGEETEFTGTVCLSRAVFGEGTYAHAYVCPVYETGDGSLIAGQGNVMAGALGDSSVSVRESETVTENGKKTVRAFGYTVAFQVVDPLVSARMLAFDGEHRLLSEQALDLSGEEIRYAAPDGAAYLILEETREGRQAVSRQIASLGEWDGDVFPFTLYVPQADGVCLPVQVTID